MLFPFQRKLYKARELTAKYGVKQAQTLVVRTGEGFEKFRGVSDIKGWLMSQRTTQATC